MVSPMPTAKEHQVRMLRAVLDAILHDVSVRRDYGALADYIALLGRIDPRKFGIAIATRDGQVLAAGDADEPFSISKVFALTLAAQNDARITGPAYRSRAACATVTEWPRNPRMPN
jgi:glutaminase